MLRALNYPEAIRSSFFYFYRKKWWTQSFIPNTCSHHQIFCWQICLSTSSTLPDSRASLR